MQKKVYAVLLAAFALAVISAGTSLAGTLISGPIATNTTWHPSGGPYLVTGAAQVVEGVTLTIGPGTVVKFQPQSSLNVFGVLNVNGTSSSRIYLTDYRDDSVGGDTNRDGGKTVPAPGWYGIHIRHGGSATINYASVRYGGIDQGSNLSVAGTGRLILSNSIISDSENCGVEVVLSDSHHIISNSRISRNGGIGIRFQGNSGSTSITRSTIYGNLGHGIYGDSGVFESRVNTITLQNNTITGNGSYGIDLSDTKVTWPADGNTISGNATGSLAIAADYLPHFSASSYGDITLKSGSIDLDTTLHPSVRYLVLPYERVTVGKDATLTVPAGTAVKFGIHAGMRILGHLEASGTGDNPVVFTDSRDQRVGADSNGDGSFPGPDSWHGFDIPEGGSATLVHVTFRYAGPNGYSGSISKTGSGSLRIRDSRISDSYGISIALSDSDHSITSCTVTRNVQYGISVGSNSGNVLISENIVTYNGAVGISIAYSNATISRNTIAFNDVGIGVTKAAAVIGGSASEGNNIFANSSSGISNLIATDTVNAAYNWWGSSSGPRHAGHSSGNGDLAGDGVAFDSFLSAPVAPVNLQSFTPADQYYSHTGIDFPSPPRSFTVVNNAGRAVRFGRLAITGTSAARFHITSDSCSGKTVAAGASCSASVNFYPFWIGLYEAFLELASDDSTDDLRVYSASLRGYGAFWPPRVEEMNGTFFDYFSFESHPSIFTAEPGAATLQTTPDELNPGQSSRGDLYWIRVPSGMEQFMATVKVDLPAAAWNADREGGVMVLPETGEQPDRDNFLMTSLGYREGLLSLEAAANHGGVPEVIDQRPVDVKPVWLRIIKRGEEYHFFYSSDGTTFTPTGTGSATWDAAYLALFAWHGRGSTQPLPVSFDVFSFARVDTTPPLITSFNIEPTGDTLLRATDDTGVDSYLMSEEPLAPAFSSSVWSPHPPTFFKASEEGSKTVYVWAKDLAGNISKPGVARIVVDVTPPVIGEFRIPQTTRGSRTVAIEALAATDNVGITGYFVTEAQFPPSASAGGWSATPPTTYSFAEDGDRTLYAFAKDAAGNISGPKTAKSVNSWEVAVQTTGNGRGAVTTSPAGIACLSGSASGCKGDFTGGSRIYLNATPSAGSYFAGWSGACSGTTYCAFTVDADKRATAAFDFSSVVKVGGTSFATLQQSYHTAASGSLIQLLEGEISGPLIADRSINVIIRGGYESSYRAATGESAIKGNLLIRNGQVRVERVKVR